MINTRNTEKNGKADNKGFAKIISALLLLVIILMFFPFIYNRYEKKVYQRGYSEYVETYSLEFNVPEYIIYSVIKVESDFDKDAVSKSGAIGLMQLMPETYKWLVEKSGGTMNKIDEPCENIKYGVYLLSVLYERYNDWDIAFAAYNAGIGSVDGWLAEKPYKIGFEETENYVKKIKIAQEKYLKLYYR